MFACSQSEGEIREDASIASIDRGMLDSEGRGGTARPVRLLDRKIKRVQYRLPDRSTGSACLFKPRASQRIRPLVLRMPAMSFDPVPFNRVLGNQRIEFPPQVLIFYRLFPGRFPPTLL